MAKDKIPMKGEAPIPEAKSWFCASCGEPVSRLESNWVINGKGALLHYGQSYGMKCWEEAASDE